MSKRKKTNYPGVFYREAKRICGAGDEKVYYIVFKKGGKVFEEKVGRQFADDMTPASAARIRSERIEEKRLSRKETRNQEKAIRDAENKKWTIARLRTAYKESREDSKSLATDTSRYKKYLEPIFGEKEPKDITPLDIDRLRIRLLKTKSPQTVKHVLNHLTWIVNFGVKKGLCEGLKFRVQKPIVHNEKTEDLTSEQLKNLLEAIENHTHPQAAAMMKLVLFTGIRRGELFKLEWRDIDFERGFIFIRDPKGGPDQKIPLNDAARKLLESHPRSDSPFVFPGRGGEKITNISYQVNRIKKDAGLPDNFRPLHGLRHVYASMLASSGEVDLYALQKLLTHKSPLMTQRYAHLRDEALKNASNLAGELINLIVRKNEEQEKTEVNHHTKQS